MMLQSEYRLTAKELQAFWARADGLSYGAIGKRLNCRPSEAQAVLATAMGKLASAAFEGVGDNRPETRNTLEDKFLSLIASMGS